MQRQLIKRDLDGLGLRGRWGLARLQGLFAQRDRLLYGFRSSFFCKLGIIGSSQISFLLDRLRRLGFGRHLLQFAGRRRTVLPGVLALVDPADVDLVLLRRQIHDRDHLVFQIFRLALGQIQGEELEVQHQQQADERIEKHGERDGKDLLPAIGRTEHDGQPLLRRRYDGRSSHGGNRNCMTFFQRRFRSRGASLS